MASAPVGALPAYRVDGAGSPGIAGAVAYDAEGCIEVILDWKCDVDIDAKTVEFLSWAARRLSAAHWALHGFLVLMTPGKVITA